jgi:GIY-YIG catalytic domain
MNQQLRLLPAPKPLNDRLGAAFFRGIPRAPGVYRMFDEAGLLLYVGQSSDLRDRLNSYRHVHPDRDSKKTNKLVHLVRRIEWEVCDSAVSAVLMENELLRTLRPRFNRMGGALTGTTRFQRRRCPLLQFTPKRVWLPLVNGTNGIEYP